MIEVIEGRRYLEWYKTLDYATKGRIISRLERVADGNFGDHKLVGDGVWELRCTFAGGIRIYYTFDGETVVLLLAGGNKSTQRGDIKLAKQIAKEASDGREKT